MSPNYPNPYPNNAEETWIITAPMGSIIILQFHSFLVNIISLKQFEYKLIILLYHIQVVVDVNDHYFNDDHLELYDGLNDEGIKIAKLKGNLGEFSISSLGSHLYVYFESDADYDESTGFHASIHYGNSYFAKLSLRIFFLLWPLKSLKYF